MENLDECLVNFDKKGLQYINNKGFEMFENIQIKILKCFIQKKESYKEFSKKLVLTKSDFD